MSIVAKFCRFLRVGVGVVALGSPALATELEVTIACPAWAPEASAQVEARIRASLLLESLDRRRVTISCQADATTVEVESASGSLVRPVQVHSSALEDDVVEAVESALRELASAAAAATAEPAAEVPPEPTTGAPTPILPTAVSPPPPPLDRRETERAQPGKVSVADMQARALVEKWGSAWAWGAEAGLTAGDTALEYGLALGARTATGEPASFALSEWTATARLQLTSLRLAGLCGSFGVGGSLVLIRPTSNVTIETQGVLGAGFLELGISRPFFFGSLGVAPAIGGRAFAAPRQVLLNEHEEFALPTAVLQASLSLIYRRH